MSPSVPKIIHPTCNNAASATSSVKATKNENPPPPPTNVLPSTSPPLGPRPASSFTLDLVRNQRHQSSSSSPPTPPPQPPPRRVKATDPFHFYSDPANLKKALNFEQIDYEAEETRQREAGSTARKTRISFEMDAFTLMLEMDDL